MKGPRTYPVVELFGPTVQGEGPAQGERCWFLRLGGCDYRCEWCDSMHAVDPAKVRQAEQLESSVIAARLRGLGMGAGDLLILSGGNPALHHLDPLVSALRGVRLHVETQGTRWRSWLNRTELVVVSPKPPSAFPDKADNGVGGADKGIHYAHQFVARLTVPWVLKLVAFDDLDLNWAVACRQRVLAGATMGWHRGSYLSAGTEQQTDDMAGAVVDRYRWLANEHVTRDDLAPFRIGLQAHVLAWPGELAR